MVWFAGWLWQGVALSLLTALILHTSRAVNAATRYALWWLTLLIVFGHPLAPVLAPFFTSSGSAPSGAPSSSADPELFAFTVPHLPDWMITTGAVLWALAVLWNLVRLGVAIHGVRVLRRSAEPIDPAIEANLPLWREAAKSGRGARLCVSDAAVVPCALGLGRPLVIVPRRLLTALAPHDIDQIAVHEHAHLQRYDDWGRFLQVVIEQLVPFHPAVRWIAARLDLEREIASDDWVVARTGAPAAYARCLTRLAEQLAPAVVPDLTPAALRRRAQVVSRVERLLDPSRNRRPRMSAWAALTLAILMIALSPRAEHLLGIREAGDFDPFSAAHAQEVLSSHEFAHAEGLTMSRLPALGIDAAAYAAVHPAADGRHHRAFSRAGASRPLPLPMPPPPAPWRRGIHRSVDAPDAPSAEDIDSALHDLDDRRALQFRPIALALDRIAAGAGPPDGERDPAAAPARPVVTDPVPDGVEEGRAPVPPAIVREGVTAPPAPTGVSRKPQFFSRMGRSVKRLFGIHVRSPGEPEKAHAHKAPAAGKPHAHKTA